MENETARILADYLDCSCRVFSPETSPAEIVATYWAAREEGKTTGFVPVLVAPDETLLESLKMNLEGELPAEYRRKLLDTPVENGEDYFAPLLSFRKRIWNAMEIESDEESGEEPSDNALNDFLGVDASVLLAEIPADNPWEIFAYLPFGGWNDCPDTRGMMAAAKTWYERYGAMPAVVMCDTLQFAVPEPIDETQALPLAWEQYAWCPDIVEQGCGSVDALAAGLRKSTVWFFWWD